MPTQMMMVTVVMLEVVWIQAAFNYDADANYDDGSCIASS